MPSGRAAALSDRGQQVERGGGLADTTFWLKTAIVGTA